MTPGLIQRHHDYVLNKSVDGRLATVAAGASIQGLEVALDTDAPFLLRSRALHVKYSAARTQAGLGHLLMRYAGPDRDYRSQDYVRQALYGPYFGQLGNPIPVVPQVVYPRGGIITVDIYNDGATDLTDLILYFRGVKLFAPGAVKSYGYPAQMSTLPFIYPLGILSTTDTLRLVRNVAVTQEGLRQTFQCKSDADFVLRAVQAGLPFSTTPVNEVFLQFRDEDEKPYSNYPVHMDVLCGNSGFAATYAAGGGNISPIGCGPNSPGLFFPEIYVPKNHVMYVDVSRHDVSYAGAVAVNLPVSLIGQKVFEK